MLGGGVALALLLTAGPAMAAPGLRRPNVRGRPVAVVPGVFPALAVVTVAAVHVVWRPDRVSLVIVMLAVTFGLGGLVVDLVGGARATRRGLEIGGLVTVAEIGMAMVAGSLLVPGLVGAVAAAVLILAGALSLRAPWPPGIGVAAGALALLPLSMWATGSPMVVAVAPGAAAGAVLAPLDLRGRLRSGQAATGSLGASVAAVVAARTGLEGRLLVTGAALAMAGAGWLMMSVRRRRTA